MLSNKAAAAATASVAALNVTTTTKTEGSPNRKLPMAPTPYAKFSYDALRRRWPADNAGMAGIPKRSWPEVQPSASDIPKLELQLQRCAKRAGGSRCIAEKFRLATAYLDDVVQAKKALKLYAENANLGDADSLCALGQCYQHGIGCQYSDEIASRYYLTAAGLGHDHARYAIGSYFYLGDGPLEENEHLAVTYFAKAAAAGHASAMYMLGDCLLEASGDLDYDKPTAMRWLLAAGDAGHRGARSRLFAILEQEKYDSQENKHSKFTDASRQTVKRRATCLTD